MTETVSQAARETLRDRIAKAIEDCPGSMGFSYEQWCVQAADEVMKVLLTRSGEREPAPSSERELLHLIRNALYQHLPTEVDADTCRAVADEVIKAIGGEGAPEVDDDLVGRLCKLHSKMRPKTRGPDRWRPRMIEVSLSEATTVIKAAVELERYCLASTPQEPALDLHTLEEAANVAERHHWRLPENSHAPKGAAVLNRGRNDAAKTIATAIRALKGGKQ